MASMEPKSKVLVIGGLTYIGRYIAIASVKLGHPTLALLPTFRTTDPTLNIVIQSFINQGVVLFKGDIYDHAKLVEVIRAVDVVISAVGFSVVMEQTRILAAIQEAGNIKRFIPSEFGIDVDRTNALQPAQIGFERYAQMRRFVEQSGVPYTYVVSNLYAGKFLVASKSEAPQSVPLKVPLLGDGNTKVVMSVEKDVAVYTMLAADDSRTLNKILYIRPPKNIISLNELVSLWERKVNKKFQRKYIPEEAVLKRINEAPLKMKAPLAVLHSAFIKGEQTNYEIDPSFGVEASHLFPGFNYTTLDEYMNRFV